MRTIVAPLAGLIALTCGVGAAWAASPAYCALYAKEFVKHAAVDSQGSVPPGRIHDRAYHRCLNMDDEPLLPTAYAEPGEDGYGGPFALVEGSYEPVAGETHGADSPGAAVEEAALEPPSPQPEAETQGGSRRGSGYAMWSREWRAWCSRHFPNSFDPRTGTMVPYETGVRTICR
jgi:hypothetical protein